LKDGKVVKKYLILFFTASILIYTIVEQNHRIWLLSGEVHDIWDSLDDLSDDQTDPSVVSFPPSRTELDI
jgi:hypothetical protein